MSAQTATILVTDLVGSTELRVRLGEDDADALRREHDDLLTAAVTAAGGTVVKGLGDGVLAMFASSADAVAAATEVQQGAHRHGRAHPDRALSIRVGISAGDVSVEDGDCFGTPVIEAARLCAAAQGGQILAADLVEALARGRGGHTYEPVGELDLKGLPAPVRTVAVVWSPPETGASAQPPFPPLLRDERSVAFVGRPAELEDLVGLWKQAAAGQRRCALLSGEPGVGKTRLASEVAQRAHDEGATVLLGRCEEELGVPFQPFVEALAYFTATTEPTAADLGRYPADLARLYPELGDLVPGLGQPIRGDAEVERHRLFEATTSWLSTAATPGGLVLVLDDLHWAGKPTLLLLRHLLRSTETATPVLVIGTYRDTDLDRTHPLGELLADLRREPGVERVALVGFTPEEVEEFLVAASGEELDDPKRALAAAVHAETEGNAFFVGEVLRNLAESGAIVQRDGVWQAAVSLEEMAIPEGVREVIGRRVSRLSEPVNDVLRWASVIGREVDFRVVADVLCGAGDGGAGGGGGYTEDDLLGALDEAIDARLLDETSRGSYRFVHALVRSTLLDEVRTARRLRMHRRIAEAIERRRPDDVAALAYHFAEAATVGAVTKAIEYGLQAAGQALERSAYDEAVTRYQRALDLLDDSLDGEADDPDRRLDLLLGLGAASFALGGGTHERPLAEAVALARSLGDAERMAEALLITHRGFGSITFAVDERRVTDIEDALALLAEEDSVTRALLLAVLSAEVAGDRDDGGRARALEQEARAMAERLGDDRALTEALQVEWAESLTPMRDEWVDPLLAEFDAAAERLGDVTVQSRVLSARLQAALERADLDEADRLERRLGAEADRLGTALAHWTHRFTEAGLALYRGDHDQAERLVEEAFVLAQEAGQSDAFQFYGCQLLFLRIQQGRAAEVVDLVADWIAGRPPGHEYWQSALALLYVECDRLDDARLAFGEAFAIYPGHRYDITYVVNGATLAHVAVALGDREAAAVLLDALLPYRGALAHWRSLATLGPVDLATGRLLLLLDRPDEARAHLAASAEICERGGLRPFLAQTRLAQGQGAAALGDGTAARAFLGGAVEIAEAGGYGTTSRRAAAALAALPG